MTLEIKILDYGDVEHLNRASWCSGAIAAAPVALRCSAC